MSNHIATSFPASEAVAAFMASLPADGGFVFHPDSGLVHQSETRSEWRWFRLANGDLILGFFPQGDFGYFGIEVAVENDYDVAESGGRLVHHETEDDGLDPDNLTGMDLGED